MGGQRAVAHRTQVLKGGKTDFGKERRLFFRLGRGGTTGNLGKIESLTSLGVLDGDHSLRLRRGLRGGLSRLVL